MKQHEIKLHDSDISFLEKNIKNNSALFGLRSAIERGPITVKGKYATDKYNVKLSAVDVSAILDELGDLLSLRGLEINSEPNSLGRRIEGLIDIFSDSYYE